MSAIFGPAIVGWQVQQAVIAHLRGWMPDYLPQAEREAEVILEREIPHLPQPRSYTVTPREPDRWKEDQLPAILVISSGLTDKPTQDGNGTFKGTFDIGVASICSAGDEEMTGLLAHLYFAAVSRILIDKPSLGGFAQGTTWQSEEYDFLSGERDRTLASGYGLFAVTVDQIRVSTGGPTAHLGDPEEDPGDWPTVDTTELELEKL